MALPLDLDDRSILVVGGGGGGIGSAVCDQLAAAGATVGAISAEPDHVADTVERITASGGRAEGRTADVRDAGDLIDAIADLDAALDGLDGVVNVVGGATVPHWHRLTDYPLDSFDHLISTNLRYVLVSCGEIAHRLVERGRGGSMVNISSIASRGAPLLAGYGAAKAGLDSLTHTMAAEWGRHDIRVNGVAPGTINTPRAGRTDTVDEAARLIPLGRRGLPADIADAVVFLLSERASYITGHVLVVDGGASHRSAGLDDHDLPVFVTNPDIRRRFE